MSFIVLSSASERGHVVFLPTFGVIPTTSHSARTLCLKSAQTHVSIETKATHISRAGSINFTPLPLFASDHHLGSFVVSMLFHMKRIEA